MSHAALLHRSLPPGGGRTPSLLRTVHVVIATSLAWLATPAGAQGDPDIFLASLGGGRARVTVGTPRNVTARPGYDNQPSFSRDGSALFYTSTRDDAQADIYRITLATGAITRVTHTAPESEYSAAEVPGGGAISVIRVERDSAQRLWRVPLSRDGGRESPYLPALKPVGYHAWADDTHLVMFVLGTPSNLVVGDLQTGRADTVMVNVGRSLHRIPGTNHVSYVSKAYEENWYVMDLDVATRASRPIARLPKGTEDYAWLPDGRLVAGSGSKLFVADPRGTVAWEEVADLAGAGLSSISRLAVSPAGDRIAIVAIPVAK
ncbi:MAG: PD40 domain-containing protein [Gemmatimonadaceae bacterium]|nr:PD40 domain-containing protein [Gemmatimonadaceae bacterium]